MKSRALLIAIFFVVLVVGAISAPGRADAACSVRIGDLNWDSANFHDQVAAFILKHGYGCQVTLIYGASLPIMTAHYQGKNDLIMELWYDNVKDQYDPAMKSGQGQASGCQHTGQRTGLVHTALRPEGESGLKVGP